MSFDLYGCVQALVIPSIKTKVAIESKWFDVSRLVILKKKPVMEVPNYEYGHQAQGLQGCADKPQGG